MKIKLIVVAGILSTLFSHSVLAISEAYRAQLEQSGCTQVSEANGTCNPEHISRHHSPHGHVDNYRANQDTLRMIEKRLDSHVAGTYQGEAVDYMEDAGWHALNQEHTRWRKDGMVVDFDMTSSGKVAGVIFR